MIMTLCHLTTPLQSPSSLFLSLSVLSLFPSRFLSHPWGQRLGRTRRGAGGFSQREWRQPGQEGVPTVALHFVNPFSSDLIPLPLPLPASNLIYSIYINTHTHTNTPQHSDTIRHNRQPSESDCTTHSQSITLHSTPSPPYTLHITQETDRETESCSAPPDINDCAIYRTVSPGLLERAKERRRSEVNVGKSEMIP